MSLPGLETHRRLYRIHRQTMPVISDEPLCPGVNLFARQWWCADSKDVNSILEKRYHEVEKHTPLQVVPLRTWDNDGNSCFRATHQQTGFNKPGSDGELKYRWISSRTWADDELFWLELLPSSNRSEKKFAKLVVAVDWTGWLCSIATTFSSKNSLTLFTSNVVILDTAAFHRWSSAVATATWMRFEFSQYLSSFLA